jgi:hypothetical protein
MVEADARQKNSAYKGLISMTLQMWCRCGELNHQIEFACLLSLQNELLSISI